jgi:hypothetical protein
METHKDEDGYSPIAQDCVLKEREKSQKITQ